MNAPAVSWQKIRAFLLPTLLLAIAFSLALLSSAARAQGQPYASGFLAVCSLALAAVSSILLIPKLLAQVRLDFLEQLRFLRLTRRGLGFSLVVLLIGFCALNTGNNLLILILSALLAALIVSGLVSNLVLHKLAVSLRVPHEIHAGDEVVVRLTLENRKRFFPSFALNLSCGGQEPSSEGVGTGLCLSERRFPYVPARRRSSLRSRHRFRRRGLRVLDGFEVRTGFPFGVLIRGRRLPVQGRITVYPRLLDVRPLLRRLAENGPGPRERKRRGQGGGLYKIRDFQGGDSTRFIHWKSTAKLGQLMVKDFLAEDELPAQLLFSRFLPAGDEKSRQQFERAVSCLASLGRYFRQQGRPFRFRASDFEVSVNGKLADYRRFMEYLAGVRPVDAPETFEQAPGRSILFAAGRRVRLPFAATIDYLEL